MAAQWPSKLCDHLDEVIPKCPLDHLVKNFPCPGPYKHQLQYYEVKEPIGRKKILSRIGVFANLMFTPQGGPYPSGNTCTLNQAITFIQSLEVDAILQLGNCFDPTCLESKRELDAVINDLKCEFGKVYKKVFHVMGDTEAAVRSYYIKSFFGDITRQLNDTRGCVRNSGNQYYSVDIAPSYTMIVVDGYELLVIDPKRCDLPCDLMNSEETGEGFTIRSPLRDSTGKQCCMHSTDDSLRIGWAEELQVTNQFITKEEQGQIPRIRTAISRSQLQWLDFTLMSCLQNNKNVIIACHSPVHPLLVNDRSTLVMNWRDLLKLFMRYANVRMVLSGRTLNEGSQPCPNMPPFTRDHGILYFSVPPVGKTHDLQRARTTQLLIDLGFDFIRVSGEGLCLPCAPTGCIPTCIHYFRPKQKVSQNDQDYTFNRAMRDAF